MTVLMISNLFMNVCYMSFKAFLLSTCDIFKEDIIVVLKTLNLHIMNQLNALHVKGIITSSKSITSHAAIIAKQKGIPSLFGVDDLDQFQHGDLMILDADEKRIHMLPNAKMLASYAQSEDKDLIHPSQYTQWQTEPAQTMDGISIPIEANMSSIQDLDAIKVSGAEGLDSFVQNFYL